MKLSIVIPVYNEHKTIAEIIRRVMAVNLAGVTTREIIVVDDGSTDGTPAILDQFKDTCQIIRQSINQGKGAAVTTGLKVSSGDVVVIQDADLEYNPDDFAKLLQPIIDQQADVVFGSRFLGSQSHRVLYFWHYCGNVFLTLLSNAFTNLNLSDMETCYKAFTRQVVNDIKNSLISKRFGIEPEITARVKSYRIFEVGVSYAGRTYAEGKKINWRDGLAAIYSIIRFNL